MFFSDFVKELLHIGQQMNMTEKQFLEKEIQQWLQSPERRWQILGAQYYRCNQDIDNKLRQVIGKDGILTTVANLPNNKLMDNRYAFLVDQKANYLLAKPLDAKADNEQAQDIIDQIFGAHFRRTLKNIGKDSLTGGISYLFPYIDNNELRFKRFHSYEILPFWADEEHTKLDAFLRMYPQEVYEGQTKKIVQRVEWYKPEGIQKFIYESGTLKSDSEDITPYFVINNAEGDSSPQPYIWGKVPLVAFKANSEELPLIKRVKSLQDALNTLYSTFMDNMQEDPRNTILIIRNYDGENLGEFRQKLAQYGAVKVRDEGGVDALNVNVSSDNYKTIIDIIRKAIIDNGRGLDTKDDRLASGAPNQMNIRSMYNDIDLDADDMEMEFQAGLEQLIEFVNQFNAGFGRPTTLVQFIFNRDTMTNETDTINNCRASTGIISEETILANHPWVKNSKEEMDRVEAEKQKQMQQMMSNFPVGNNGGADNGQ